MTKGTALFGKYRGKVLNNVDPLGQGRIQAQVLDLMATNWAAPCFPVAGMFGVPPIGSLVWIEFEKGDLDYPIWTGCFYGSSAEVPEMAKVGPPMLHLMTVETPSQNGITITDAPGPTGGITIKSSSGATIIVNATGIYLSNGQGASIEFVGPSVIVNNGALSVT